MGDPGGIWVGLGSSKSRSKATHVATDADHGNEAVRSVGGTPLGIDRPWRDAGQPQTRDLPLHEATCEKTRGCASNQIISRRKPRDRPRTSLTHACPLNRMDTFTLTHQQCKLYYGRDKQEILLTQVPDNVHRLRPALKPNALEIVLLSSDVAKRRGGT